MPGRCKTRLIPALGAEGAARLAGALLAHTVARVTEGQVAPAVLCCHPDAADPAFAPFSLEKWNQRGTDLGERMYRGAVRALEEAEGVLLIGSDCPGYSAGYLESALAALGRNDLVLGPARDGGYVLLGLKRVERALFQEVPWGTGRVLEETLRRAEELGWSAGVLEPLWDVDRPEDLARLRREYPAISPG